MKVLFYHSTYFLNHHLGVLLDEAEKIFREGHEVYFAVCHSVVDVCFINSSCDKSVCKLCKWSTGRALNNLSKGIKRINLDEYKTSRNNSCPNLTFQSLDEIKKIEYKGVKIGYGVLSSYITATRNNDPCFDEVFNEYVNKLLNSTVALTDALDNLIDSLCPDMVCLFNGRFYEHRPAYELSLSKGIKVRCYEVIGGYGEDYYKVHYDNVMPHNIQANIQKVEELWEDKRVSLEKKYEIGKSFFENRRNGKPACDKIYTKNQQSGVMPSNWDSRKRNFVIFNSSEDEFIAIGDEYDSLAFFPSQIIGIKRILSLFSSNSDIHFYLRIHPNLTGIQYKYHTELYKLEDEFSNITVIAADAKVSSYDLMEQAEKIIVFGSTMGMEAAYWKKPVILLGGAVYTPLDLCYKPVDEDELQNLLLSQLEAKDNLIAIKFGYFYMHRDENAKFDYIDFNVEK